MRLRRILGSSKRLNSLSVSAPAAVPDFLKAGDCGFVELSTLGLLGRAQQEVRGEVVAPR